MTQKFANAARAYLASTVSDSATTVTIDGGGSLFPAITSPEFSRAVLQDANGIEVVRITAHTANSDSFTVTRGQEGTTARSFAAGSVFGIRMTAADGDTFVAKQNALVSGTNIKTVNGDSLLGSGDLEVSGGLEYVVKTANYTAVDKQGVLTDTSGGSFTVTLPATPSVGAQIVVADAGASWGTNNLTVGRNGSTIGDLAEDLVCDITGASVQFVYDGTTWEVYVQIGGQGGVAVTESDTQTLTNKTIAFADNTLTGVVGTTATQTLTNKTIAFVDNTLTGVVGTTATQTLTNKTIAFSSNTLTDVASTNTAQTLTNKTIAFADNTLTGVVGTTATQTLTNKTISGADNVLTVDGTNAVGFRIIPQNSQSTAYTAVLADSGKQIFHPSADTTARTFTIPANSSVAYPIGTALTFINQNGAGVVTIAITSDTMRLAGAGTTGSRTLAANGVATAIKLTATEWLISGTGLT